MDDPVNDFAFEEFFDQLDTPPRRATAGTESLDVFPSETPTPPDIAVSSTVAELPVEMSVPITSAPVLPVLIDVPPATRVPPLALMPLPLPASTPVQTVSREATSVASTSAAPPIHARDEELRAMVESADARIAEWKAQLRTMRRPSLWSRSPLAAAAVVAAVVLLGVLGAAMWSRRAAPDASPDVRAVAPGIAPPSREPADAATQEVPRRADDSSGKPPRRLAATQQAERPRPATPTSERGAVGTVGRSAAGSSQPQRPSPAGRHTDAVVIARQAAPVPIGASSAAILSAVEVDVTVDTGGHAIKAIALAGDDAWRRAAEAAALQWRYEPATDDGVAVVSDLRVRVPFE